MPLPLPNPRDETEIFVCTICFFSFRKNHLHSVKEKLSNGLCLQSSLQGPRGCFCKA